MCAGTAAVGGFPNIGEASAWHVSAACSLPKPRVRGVGQRPPFRLTTRLPTQLTAQMKPKRARHAGVAVRAHSAGYAFDQGHAHRDREWTGVAEALAKLR